MKPIYECGDNLNAGMLCLQQTHSNSVLINTCSVNIFSAIIQHTINYSICRTVW